MNINQATKEKLEKTIERMKKAIGYNDYEYMSELVHDLTEFAYFSGYIEAETNTRPNKPTTKKAKGTNFTPIAHGTIESQISSLIFNLGVPSHIKGHRYLIDAVSLTYEDPTLISRLTKELYPFISKKYNTTASRVERAIRHSIEVGWSRGNTENLSKILGYPVAYTKAKPTNSEYIKLLADYIRNQNETDSLISLVEKQSSEMSKVNHDQPTAGFYLNLVQMSQEAKEELSEEHLGKVLQIDVTDKDLIEAIDKKLLQLEFQEEMSHFPLLRTLIYITYRNPELLENEIELYNQLSIRYSKSTERVNRVIQDALSMRFPTIKRELKYEGSNPMKLSTFAKLVINKLNLE